MTILKITSANESLTLERAKVNSWTDFLKIHNLLNSSEMKTLNAMFGKQYENKCLDIAASIQWSSHMPMHFHMERVLCIHIYIFDM